MYDGTLADNWQALITFQQMIVLCDSDGIIDMTPGAISRRTGIPHEHIEEGIKFLEKDDPYSKTTADNGRRIVPLDNHRPWGWRIVNHAIYKKMASMADKKKADRERIAQKREESKAVADSRKVSHGVAKVAHTDADANTDANIKEPAPSGQPSADLSKKSKHFEKAAGKWFEDIKYSCSQISILSEQSGKKFNPFQWVQQKTNQGGHPGAIDQALDGLIKIWTAADDPWAYIDKIFKTQNGNWHEKDAIKIHEALKQRTSEQLKAITSGLIKEI